MRQTRVYIDLVGLSQADAASRLLESVRLDRARAKPERPPDFPGAPAISDTVPQFPRQGPSITNLPARNPNFTGREQLLETLHQELGTAAKSPGPRQGRSTLRARARPSWCSSLAPV